MTTLATRSEQHILSNTFWLAGGKAHFSFFMLYIMFNRWLCGLVGAMLMGLASPISIAQQVASDSGPALQPRQKPAKAQLRQAAMPLASLASPSKTLITFLESTHDTASTATTQIAASIFRHPHLKTSERIRLAKKFRRSLDGTGTILAIEEAPKDSAYQDPQTGKHTYMPLEAYERIYLVRQGQEWFFPATSVQAIQDWHQEVFPLGLDRLSDLLPHLSTWRLGDFHFWQLILLLAMALVLYLFYQLSGWLIYVLFLKALHKYFKRPLTRKYIEKLSQPLRWALIFFLSQLFLPALALPLQVAHYLILTLHLLGIVFVTACAFHGAALLQDYLLVLRSKKEGLESQLIRFMVKALRLCILCFGGLYALDYLKVPIFHLLTGLSIGGLALALAAQDTIKNLFGSVMIFLDKPFGIGDWVTCGDIDGTVESVDLRSTRIRTFRDSLVYVSNAQLANSTIDNHGKRSLRRYYARLRIPFDTPVKDIEAFCQGLHELHDTHPLTDKQKKEIHVHQFSEHGLVIMFYIFLRAPTWSEELAACHALNLGILHLAEKLHIRFIYQENITLSSSKATPSHLSPPSSPPSPPPS